MKDLAPPSVIFVLMSHSLEIGIFNEISKLRFKKCQYVKVVVNLKQFGVLVDFCDSLIY